MSTKKTRKGPKPAPNVKAKAVKSPEKSAKTVDPVMRTLFESPSRGELQRVRIIETAIQCIASEGIDQTNIETIAKRMGTRRSHIAYYFKEADEIVQFSIQYIIRKATESVLQQVSRAGSPRQRLEAYMTANFDWGAQNEDFAAVMLLFYYYARIRPKYRAMQKQIMDTAIGRIAALLQPLVPGSDPKVLHGMALNIYALIFGHIIALGTTLPKFTEGEIVPSKQAALAGLDSWLRTSNA